MKIILDEAKVVAKALNEGYCDSRKPTSTIRLLIKYYYGIGQDKTQVRDSIENFMKKNYKGFNEVKWQDLLDNMVTDLQKDKHELFVLHSVRISSNELDTIKNINNKRLEKLAFVLLVYAKIYNQMNNNQSNWVNSELKDIFSDTKMAVGTTEQAKMVHKLKELGLVDISKRVDCTNIKILYVHENDVIIEITDFRDFVYEYMRWNGEKIGSCEECGTLINIKNNKIKYCRSCAKKIKLQNDRRIQKDRYQNSRK
jgi:hypothetical protein